jgi:hypothetical protein
MRFMVLAVTWLFSGLVYADFTQRLEMRIAPSESDPKVFAIDVMTTIATDSRFPELLEFEISTPPGFLGVEEPHLEGDLVFTAPSSIDSLEDGEVIVTDHESKSWSWRVKPGDSQLIRVRYRVPLTFDQRTSARTGVEHILPYVADDHGMIGTLMTTGTTINALPNRVLAKVMTPKELELFSPWPIAKDAGSEEEIWYEVPLEAIMGYEYLPVGAWVGPSLTIGEFRVHMLFSPSGARFEPRLRQPLEKIIDYGIRLFGVPMQDTFLFAFRINESGSGRISATTATNSIYFLFDSRVAELDPEPMFHVIAHEFVHLWGRHSLAIGQVEDMRWLHEGFTDYYASQICFRLGLLSEESFKKDWIAKLETAENTPARGRWSIAAAGPMAMQGDTPSQELTYQGGWLLAAWLDAAIRKKALAGDNKHEFIPSAGDVAKPGTLDVLMRDFYNDPQWNKHVRPTPALFLERLAKYLPAEQVAKFEKFTTEPWQFNSEVEFSALGFPVERKQVPAERLGLALEPGKLIVQNLQPGKAGVTMGLHKGDEILRINRIEIHSIADLRPAWLESDDEDVEIIIRRGEQEIALRGKKPREDQVQIDPSLLLR